MNQFLSIILVTLAASSVIAQESTGTQDAAPSRYQAEEQTELFNYNGLRVVSLYRPTYNPAAGGSYPIGYSDNDANEWMHMRTVGQQFAAKIRAANALCKNMNFDNGAPDAFIQSLESPLNIDGNPRTNESWYGYFLHTINDLYLRGRVECTDREPARDEQLVALEIQSGNHRGRPQFQFFQYPGPPITSADGYGRGTNPGRHYKVLELIYCYELSVPVTSPGT